MVLTSVEGCIYVRVHQLLQSFSIASSHYTATLLLQATVVSLCF